MAHQALERDLRFLPGGHHRRLDAAQSRLLLDLADQGRQGTGGRGRTRAAPRTGAGAAGGEATGGIPAVTANGIRRPSATSATGASWLDAGASAASWMDAGVPAVSWMDGGGTIGVAPTAPVAGTAGTIGRDTQP